MTGNVNFKYTLPSGQSVFSEPNAVTSREGDSALILVKSGNGWCVEHFNIDDNALLLMGNALNARPDIDLVYLNNMTCSSLASIDVIGRDGKSLVYREMINQQAAVWLTNEKSELFPLKMVLDADGYHPLRSQPQHGELYRRFIPSLQQTLTISGLDLDVHLPLFHRWQNSDRVSAFWEQTGSMDEHATYLQTQLNNAKNQLLILSLDDEPFAYIEAYWAKEDRIAAYYESGQFDRGIHMLVGEEHHRGKHKVAAWLPSVCHFLYLDDPRTQKIVSEPRSDNDKMIRYLQQHGFAKIKEFQFPHKRAALMSQLRETFFESVL
ncbi:GNAT family N-acetyltransferase [Enterovibrio calviensis]|uniref:GNAT family N-acetyltransferase n=1 Tax=Enterovibrio calviensis TaxID=91359 RepID=UPI0037356C2E